MTLTTTQYQQLASICADLGNGSLLSIAIPYVLRATGNPWQLLLLFVLAVSLSVSFWVASGQGH